MDITGGVEESETRTNEGREQRRETRLRDMNAAKEEEEEVAVSDVS